MKKLFAIAALMLAATSFAQAQGSAAGLAGHPDARNDRHVDLQSPAQHVRHAKRHHVKARHHAKRHHRARHAHRAHHAK